MGMSPDSIQMFLHHPYRCRRTSPLQWSDSDIGSSRVAKSDGDGYLVDHERLGVGVSMSPYNYWEMGCLSSLRSVATARENSGVTQRSTTSTRALR